MKSRTSKALITLAFLSCAAPAVADSSFTSAVPLKLVPTNAIPDGLIESICARLPVQCNPKTAKAFSRNKANVRRGPEYIIDESRPMFIELDVSDPTNADRARLWDFSDYRHSHPQPESPLVSTPLGIHPALYPIGGDYALAILSRLGEMYSGGGTNFEVADFVVLGSVRTSESSRPDWHVAYAAIPFSCSSMIRACFSKMDYKRSPHCHDETRGYLTIRFPKNGEAKLPWAFTWHEFEWPAHARGSEKVVSRTQFTPSARRDEKGRNALPDNVSFCGGPAS